MPSYYENIFTFQNRHSLILDGVAQNVYPFESSWSYGKEMYNISEERTRNAEADYTASL